jgi:ATP-dependent DNA helicase RecG
MHLNLSRFCHNNAPSNQQPAVAKITWILKDRDNIEKDYEHFGCPLLLSVNQVYAKIRNLKYRYLPE